MIVLDDPIVDQGDPSRLMGMGIFIGDTAVGGPPGVADPTVGVDGELSAGFL